MSTKVKDVIARLNEYDPEQTIAINWWLPCDFEDSGLEVEGDALDMEICISLAQDYLDNLNIDLIDYVHNNY